MIDNGAAYSRAKRRVNAKIGFYFHLTFFVIINALLIFINLATSADYLWYKWPMAGWGLGLLFHGIGVFLMADLSLAKKDMIEKEMAREKLKE